MIYVEKLNYLFEQEKITKREKDILMLLWKNFKIELPPYEYLKPIYNFFLFYFLLFIGITLVVFFVLLGYIIFESFDEAEKNFSLVNDKYFNIIAFLTVLLLVITEAIKNDNNWCDFEEEYWRIDFEDCINKRTNILFVIFSFFTIVSGVIIFKSKFIVFTITVLGIIIIYETMKSLMKLHSVKTWKRIKITTINFDLISEDVIDDITHKVKLYSLEARYTYEINKKEYFSSQIYIDEPRDKKLFQSRVKHHILQWIQNNGKQVKYLYVNPKNNKESVLFKDILQVSFLGKYLIIVGTIIMIYIFNKYVDLSFYFG